jgi:hypothetical protein
VPAALDRPLASAIVFQSGTSQSVLRTWFADHRLVAERITLTSRGCATPRCRWAECARRKRAHLFPQLPELVSRITLSLDSRVIVTRTEFAHSTTASVSFSQDREAALRR